MGNYTREEILQMAEEEDVEFIRLQFTDMFGTLKNIAIKVPCGTFIDGLKISDVNTQQLTFTSQAQILIFLPLLKH